MRYWIMAARGTSAIPIICARSVVVATRRAADSMTLASVVSIATDTKREPRTKFDLGQVEDILRYVTESFE